MKLRIEQEAVMARDAFRAMLEVENRGASALGSIRVDVRIRTESGADANALFGVSLESLTRMSAVDGTGVLAGNSTGAARWQLVPTVDAAPMGATRFLVGST